MSEKKFMYEAHLHTAPVSQCASATVRDSVEFYKKLGYDGLFITNHFIDGNFNLERRSLPYADKVKFYFAAYEEGKKIGKEIGIKVFCGVETTYYGSDFLIYGLDEEWYLNHPEILEMRKSEQLTLFRENGAFIVHAHPFREDSYIDHIRLFPRHVDAVEIVNASRPQLECDMAKLYADTYGLPVTAGSDNHRGSGMQYLAAVACDTPIESISDYAEKVKNREIEIVRLEAHID